MFAQNLSTPDRTSKAVEKKRFGLIYIVTVVLKAPRAEGKLRPRRSTQENNNKPPTSRGSKRKLKLCNGFKADLTGRFCATRILQAPPSPLGREELKASLIFFFSFC